MSADLLALSSHGHEVPVRLPEDSPPLWRAAEVGKALRPRRRTGRCVNCGYLTPLPCAVCAQGVMARTVAMPVVAPTHPAYEPILRAVMAWCLTHPQTRLTVAGFHAAFDARDQLPYGLSLVYELFHSLARLRRLALDRLGHSPANREDPTGAN